MLCVVQDSKSGRLVPACSTKAVDGMDIETDSADVALARREVLELIISEHVGDCEAPCRHICPASLDIPLMMRQMTQGERDDVAVLVVRDLVLPATLGYVCPAPCQNGCRRKQVDDTMEIREMHRVVAERAFENNPEVLECLPDTGKKISIIGAGPSGLAAAWLLRKEGHSCRIYEKEAKPGGKLNALAEDKLPRAVFDREVDNFHKVGIVFEFGTEVGEAISMEEISSGADVIILACKDVKAKGDNLFPAPDHKMTVKAVGNGKAAARAAQRFLSGRANGKIKPAFESKIVKLLDGDLERILAYNVNAVALPMEVTEHTLAEMQEESGRCMHCDCRKRNSCSLRHYCTEYEVDKRKYKTTDQEPVELIGQNEGVVFEPGKCIKCGLCIEISEQAGEQWGLAFIGRGFDVQIRVPLNRALEEGLTVSAKDCIEACPTGAIAYRNKEDIRP
jgi:ferredoxin